MWLVYKKNVLRAFKRGGFKDTYKAAAFIANEYDRCIKRGGDLLYGVPVLNGNVSGMTDVIFRAFEKGQKANGENFNLLQEIYPSAFDAYWNGAEMAPFPNPILKPLGWMMTPPAPGAIMNIGPNPISLAQSAAKLKIKQQIIETAIEAFKSKTINIPPIGEVNIYETIIKIDKGEPLDKRIKNHPAVKAANSLYQKFKQTKKEKPGIGAQFKPAIKFPFPELPKRKKLIEEAKKKLKEEAAKQIKERLIPPIQEKILSPVITAVNTAVALSETIPNPKPKPEDIKKFVVDTANGLTPKISLPGVSIPKIPTKEELKQFVEQQLPTEPEILSMAEDAILGKIPKIPNVHFVPPAKVFTPPTNILIDPFVNVAKVHLLGTGGTMMVMAQYPPPAPPAPAVLQWSGYSVIG